MQCADNDSPATQKKNPSPIRPIASASIPAPVRTRTSNKRPNSDSRASSLSPLTPDPSPTMSPEDPKYPSANNNNNISSSRNNSSTSRRPSASNSGQPQQHNLPAFGDLSKPDISSAASSPRHLPSLYPNSTPAMSPSGHPLLSPASRPHYGITDPSQYSSSSGFYQLPPPLQPFGAPRQSPHHSPAIHPLSGHPQGQHPLPPLPALPSASLSNNNGYSPRSNPQMSPHMNHYLVSPALGPLSPYPTPQHQPQQHHLSSPHHHASPHHQYAHDHQRHSIPTMILPASALSSTSLSSPSGSAPHQHVHHLQESPSSSGRPYPIILPHGASSSSSSSSAASSSKKTTPPRAGGPSNSSSSNNNGGGHAPSQSGGASSASGPPTPRRYLMMPPQTVPGGASNPRGSRGSISSRKSSGSATSSPLTGPSGAPHPLLSPPSGPSSAATVSGSGTSSKRRASSHAKVVDQETRDLMRKVSHSAIERRRRERINDKILQLKHLVPSCVDEDHLHKLSILQSTIEYIQYLKSVLPASVANAKLSKATNNNPNNKTTDMLEALGGSISAKVPLTPLMTTGLNHIYAKRMSLQQQQEQQQQQQYRRRRGQDEDDDEDDDEEDEEYERRQRYQEEEDEDYEDSSSRQRRSRHRRDNNADAREDEDEDGMDRRERKKPRSMSDIDRSSSTIIKMMSGILDPQQQQHLRQTLAQTMSMENKESGSGRHPSSGSLKSMNSSSSPPSSSDDDAKDGLLLLAGQSSAHAVAESDPIEDAEMSNGQNKASKRESRRRQLNEDNVQDVGSPMED
ncbi:hypothetical protein EMPS_03809 [Entomortierella parvispora]|uniref:BHLH domain-containing protein n=1 Tax=Entomortierella parvispora TaxID=205924 RepID=A0A9P3H799_9FUNG|nr:hypothetical protein EMPS_03809 [Entomortierella parvispora]